MRLRWKKKEGEEGTASWYARIGSSVDRGCRVLSNHLQRASGRLSPARAKTVLLVFVLLAGGASIRLIWRGLTRPDPLAAPALITKPAPASAAAPGDAVDRANAGSFREGIRVFRRQMDSLRNDPVGRWSYDSLRRARPGLFDSLDRVEGLLAPPNQFSR